MLWTQRLWLKLQTLLRRDRVARRLDDEVQFHLDQQIAENLAAGMSAEEARGAALRAFGNTSVLKEETRETWGWMWLEQLLEDVRFGLRMLRKNPGFALAAVLTLALGIGANTATFTLAKAVLLDTLLVPHADQLRLLAWNQDERSVVHGTWGDFYSDGKGGIVTASFSYPVYEILRRNHSLGDLFAFNVEGGGFDRMTATIDGHAEMVTPEMVSGNYFAGLGISTELGRPIEPADDAMPGSGAVAVISDAFWMRRFGRSPSVIGKSVELNLTPVTIVGVAPHGFAGASRAQISTDVFLPLSMQPVVFPRGVARPFALLNDPAKWWVQIMGRRQAGVSEDRARASLAVALDQAVRATMTIPKDRTTPVLSLLPGDRGGLNYKARDLEQPVSILMALAALVLLLACVNIANLLSVRSAARRRELSLRLALGAGRARILWQMLTESLVLSLMGGGAGLLLGYLGRDSLSRLLSSGSGPAAFSSRFDWRVFGFTLALSVITGLIFGAATGWQVTRTSVNSALKDSGANITQGRREGLAGRLLVVVQVSLSVLLLVGAGLFVRTLGNLRSINPGFQPKGLLLFGISPPKQRYPAPKDIEVLHRLEERIAGLPGVEAATLSGQALLAGSRAGDEFLPDGQPARLANERQALSNFVGRSFLETMKIPLVAGRNFDLRDTATSPKVAIVNQALARKFFRGMNPVGETFRLKENESDRYQIIGVSADSRYGWLREDPPPTFYTLFEQERTAFDGMTFEVRTRGDAGGVLRAIRSAVQSVDKDLPLIDVRTQTQQIDATIGPERIFATVTSGFGVLALVLASVGIYGVMAYTVARRVKEIGVLMALGARRPDILKLILGQGMRLTVAGVALGMAGAFSLSRLLAAMLYGITAADPVTYTAVGLVLLLVSSAACYIPARRAMRVDPMVALRHE